MLWIGDRTRQLDGAHVEFLSGVRNPLGIKVGPDHHPDTMLALIERLNPENEPGRITLITRFGAGVVEKHLPPLLRAVKRAGCHVIWTWILTPPYSTTVWMTSRRSRTRRPG